MAGFRGSLPRAMGSRANVAEKKLRVVRWRLALVSKRSQFAKGERATPPPPYIQ